MKAAYPALFYFDTETPGYYIHFPDFPYSATQGDTISEAMEMASEYLGITLADYLESSEQTPKPSLINSLSLVDNDPFKNDVELNQSYDLSRSFISMVITDVSEYVEAGKPIKKTLTIPIWADKLGKKMNINFSQTLTDAISEKHLNL